MEWAYSIYKVAIQRSNVALYLFIVATFTVGIAHAAENAQSEPVAYVAHKRIIGPTTIVAEADSELPFKARVDTGAKTSSVHVEEWAIEDESGQMEENLGKMIRFRVKNHHGESQWIQSRIEDISVVKTSEQEEARYKVGMTLRCNDVEKKVLVTLNDRSHMKYPMLLGRNFLQGDFVVDVDLRKKPSSGQTASSEEPQAQEKPDTPHHSARNKTKELSRL